MATLHGLNYDDLMRDVAQRMETSKLSRRSSRTSVSQASKRHSTRIEKPRSAHPSPRTPERRRTLTAHKQYASLDDHYRRMMGLGDEERTPRSVDPQPPMRPVSWHPSTALPHISPAGYTSQYSANLSPTSYNDVMQTSPVYQQVHVEPTWSQYMHGQFTAASVSQAYTAVSHEPNTWYDNTGIQAENDMSLTHTITAWQATTYDASVPIENDDRATREPSVELIGLGLYDEPGFTVKIGSKLEEECEPPEEMEDANDESSEEEEEELPKPEDTKPMPTTLPMNMAGQSFFLDENEGTVNTWWSNPVKQSVPQVPSMNYGWI